jgi:hypothetical protein
MHLMQWPYHTRHDWLSQLGDAGSIDVEDVEEPVDPWVGTPSVPMSPVAKEVSLAIPAPVVSSSTGGCGGSTASSGVDLVRAVKMRESVPLVPSVVPQELTAPSNATFAESVALACDQARLEHMAAQQRLEGLHADVTTYEDCYDAALVFARAFARTESLQQIQQALADGMAPTHAAQLMIDPMSDRAQSEASAYAAQRARALFERVCVLKRCHVGC